jgi:hypothetical protein
VDAVQANGALQIATLCDTLPVPVNPIGSWKDTPLVNISPPNAVVVAYEAHELDLEKSAHEALVAVIELSASLARIEYEPLIVLSEYDADVALSADTALLELNDELAHDALSALPCCPPGAHDALNAKLA